MKKNFLIAGIAGLVLLAQSAFADVITAMTVYTNITSPATVIAGATSNFVSQPFAIQPGRGIGVGWDVTGGGTGNFANSNVTVKVNILQYGTNWPTTAPIVFGFALNDTNSARGYTNLPATLFDGARAVRLENIANGDGTNAITPNRFTLSRGKE